MTSRSVPLRAARSRRTIGHAPVQPKGSNAMQHPQAISHLQTARPESRRYMGFAFAAAVNVAVIWAIVNGLNIPIEKIIQPITRIHVLTQTDTPKPQPAPQPKVTFAR